MFFYSDITPLYFVLPAIGFIVGLFGTMLGGGGGFIFLPVLTLLLHVPASVAVSTSLVATLPICALGTLGHVKQRNIAYTIAPVFLLAGVAGTFAGAAIAGRISSEELKTAFGIYAVLISGNIFYDTWKRKKKDHTAQQRRGWTKTTKGWFFGLMAGLVTGVFGASGTAPVLAGLLSLDIPLKRVVGTSLLVILVNTVFAVGAHVLVGQTDLTLVYFLTAGSALGAIAGPRLLSKSNVGSSESKVRYGYAAVMIFIGILMIIK
ncbi:hypothetical protein PSM36_2115 [Proteiniphilum saccharofermentans]|uniref:Probable membrane transporter protein n=1 Tax=Proteiniphilum saccharofermentans TaxID=1642647 RepID=A0A1R3T446_9BACT|nr:sulfite exporter TauE/SafE family protein [Proteiniphilum saccharofermentans]SCD20922.1 hypothetical protein PSM36_2115 [Proteiniphilum saccharofermentans]